MMHPALNGFSLLRAIAVVPVSIALIFGSHGDSSTKKEGVPHCTISNKKLTLDPALSAEMNVSLQISPPLVDPNTSETYRVVSVFSFTTVQDVVQYSLFHGTQLLAVTSKEAIEAATVRCTAGSELEEFTVTYKPKDELTWGDVNDLEQVTITTSRIQDK